MKVAWIVLMAMPPLACAADPAAEPAPVDLSLKRAVEVAISAQGNTNIQLSGEALKQAQSRALQARAALLPDLEGAFNDRSQTVNLAAEGLTSIKISVPGFTFPSLVGPFSTASISLSSSTRRKSSSKAGLS